MARRMLVGAVAVALTGCSAAGTTGPEQAFAVQTGSFMRGPTNLDEVNDLGVPLLHNDTAYPVRIRSVELVDPPAALHFLNAYAYNYNTAKGGILVETGVLDRECPGEYVPYPVDSFTTRPDSDAAWFIVLAFTFTSLGRYTISRIKISYSSEGHDGWQYQNVDATFTVVNPPLPGPTPQPRSAICGGPP